MVHDPLDFVSKLARERWGRVLEGPFAERLGGLSLPYSLDDLVWWIAQRGRRR